MKLQQFSYRHQQLLPFVPLMLSNGGISIEHDALIDSGATNNVLPYQIGLELGLSWDAQTRKLTPVGFLRGAPVVGVRLHGRINPFPPVEFVFAWTRKSDVPLILGHVNFFWEFEVHFYDAQGVFELEPMAR